jgi:hypothetical protein
MGGARAKNRWQGHYLWVGTAVLIFPSTLWYRHAIVPAGTAGQND